MKQGSEFHDYVVHDLFAYIAGITSRPMFGGYGIYKDGKIFAIIVGDEPYFKANQVTKIFFDTQGSHPFTYGKKDNRVYTMNYWLVPEEILENREALMEWLGLATDAGH